MLKVTSLVLRVLIILSGRHNSSKAIVLSPYDEAMFRILRLSRNFRLSARVSCIIIREETAFL